MAPFDRSHTSSYSPSIVTMTICCIVCEVLVENREIVFSAPVGISRRGLMLVKLEWLGYRTVKKLWRYVKPFSSDTEMLRTDRGTDGQICYHYRASVCWRATKMLCWHECFSNFWGKFFPKGPLTDFYKICRGESLPGSHPHAKFYRFILVNVGLQPQNRQKW